MECERAIARDARWGAKEASEGRQEERQVVAGTEAPGNENIDGTPKTHGKLRYSSSEQGSLRSYWSGQRRLE